MLLEGVRVLEFGQYVAGPLTGMLLGDLGAEVIKIERPRGDPLRFSPAYETYNRNKSILRLDLKSAEGQENACRLIAGADVVIDGYKPGTLKRLGSIGDRLERPDVITCAITDYHPALAAARGSASDQSIAAELGLFRPADRRDPESAPTFSPLPLPSTFAALVAANSIVASLIARTRSGLGQAVEVPRHSAMLLGIGFALLRTNWEGGPEPDLVSGIRNPMVGVYRCGDGRWIQLHASLDHFVDAFVRELGLQEWREEGLFEGLRARQDAARAAEAERRLAALFLTAPAIEWEERLSRAGVSCAVCRSSDEWMHEEHARASGQVVEVQTALGRMLQPGRAVRGSVDAGPVQAARPAASDIEWAARTRVPAPCAPEPIGAALAGFKVLDLSMILAGPTASRVLAEFGADVIKIDRQITTSEAFWLDANRGKRSLLANLKTEEGKAIFWKLAQDADVVVENFRDGVAERLGVGYRDVRSRNPDVVYGSLNCYGYGGPFSGRPGWEHLAQAMTGMQARYGGRNAQPRLAHDAVNDYGTGLLAALGILAALYERQRTRHGQRVTTALVASAAIMQGPYMFSLPGYRRREIEGQAAKGYSAWRRLYRASDGWLYLDCPERGVGRLLRLEEFAGLKAIIRRGDRCGVDSAVARRLEEIFRTRTVGHWSRRAREAGVDLAPVRRAWDVFDDAGLRSTGLIDTTESDDYGTVEHVGVAQRLSRTPARKGRPTPAPGSDTVAILEEIGFERREIARLKRRGVVRSALF